MTPHNIFTAISTKTYKIVGHCLAHIDQHRRVMNLYLKEMERAEKEGDLSRAANYKYEKIPQVESVIAESKKLLIREIAEVVFRMIENL